MRDRRCASELALVAGVLLSMGCTSDLGTTAFACLDDSDCTGGFECHFAAGSSNYGVCAQPVEMPDMSSTASDTAIAGDFPTTAPDGGPGGDVATTVSPDGGTDLTGDRDLPAVDATPDQTATGMPDGTVSGDVDVGTSSDTSMDADTTSVDVPSDSTDVLPGDQDLCFDTGGNWEVDYCRHFGCMDGVPPGCAVGEVPTGGCECPIFNTWQVGTGCMPDPPECD